MNVIFSTTKVRQKLRTEVEMKASVQSFHTIVPDYLLHGVQGSRWFGNVKSFARSDSVLQLPPDL